MPPPQAPDQRSPTAPDTSEVQQALGLASGAGFLARSADPARVVVPFPTPEPAKPPPPKRPFTPRRITLLPEGGPQAATVRPPTFQRRRYVRRRALGEILVDNGDLSPIQLARALVLQRDMGMRLGDLLVRTGMLAEDRVTEALGRQHGMGLAERLPPSDPALDHWARRMPLALAREFRAIPWARIGNRTVIATARPDRVDALTAALPPQLGPCVFAVVSDRAFDRRLGDVHGAAMARAAECRVPVGLSCRRLRARRGATVLALILVALCFAILQAPLTALGLATLLGAVVMACNLGLRLAAWLVLVRAKRAGGGFATVRTGKPAIGRMPVISVLVPLHKEPEIATALTERLSRIDYPRALLDICLVVEADDLATRAALADADLPHWMRVIAVPDGTPRTKPRAMNYALNFARGDIVGVYDAEDAPAPDQLRRVAARFLAAPPEVACLQGLLDYYNPTRNWMSRCFTIEYANWFRLVLPGIARMGLVVPLGGTTLFFRRSALEAVGAWDAHNVTEDADLGIRLARKGLRTEILQTTTLEEANASPVAWIKQRSRWMKGYVLTWAVHSRHPFQLWADLGPKRFLGFHLLFLGSILNTILLPAVWSVIVLTFGVWHPIVEWMPNGDVTPLAIFFGVMTLLNMALSMAGCAAPHHRSLRPWVPTLEAYFPLASLAMGKALLEIALRPFHWDKTTHGAFGGDASGAEIETLHNGLANLR
ncbi:glycosyl transferase [Jannaschia pagri]|uniref:Glycosyl transferase n=1 Tax=Jannaschia pagri TaxID=2829797 RepID=A0ABQ4NGH8_9RHOB|nr:MULTISPECIES: glycosyltransferase family 2 protein [unclassified Jannaschia]GIT90365.1 glycosyl transferase [Jannaschia sp. AI_61]GIT93529.1 glycosyl transferase [Jannaschia sp. AI_62]